MKAESDSNSECCPKFNPEPWDDKTFEWESRHFIKESVCTLFYMPINFGGAMRRLNKTVTMAGATVSDWLCLSDHTSKWNMDLYLAVDKEIPNADNRILRGKFYSKVYEGPFKDTGKWSKDFGILVKAKGLAVKKMYMWYTTCPKCVKKYGKNYVAIIAEVE